MIVYGIRKYRLYNSVLYICVYHDAGTGILLRRSVTEKKCGKYYDDVNSHYGTGGVFMGIVRVFAFVQR